jgi:hypothetical protein
MSLSPVVGIVDVLYVSACSGIGPLTTTAEARRQRHTSARQPGRQAQNARHSAASGSHFVNVASQPLRAFFTFVIMIGSHVYRPVQQSMVQDTYTGFGDEPSAMERECAMGFMDNTICAPSITKADRRRLIKSTIACGTDLLGGSPKVDATG